MAAILVVDDEPDTLRLVKSILENSGFEVMTACNGRECLEKLRDGDIGLVLLDIMMPDMSGWEAFRTIKRTYRKLKVAFLSVVEVSAERKAALIKDGLCDYIMKPFTREELLERVHAII